MAAPTVAPASTRVQWTPVVRVNLLPPEIFEERRFRRTQRMLALAVLLVVAGAGVVVYFAQHRVTEARSNLADVQARVGRLQSEKAKYDEVPKVIAEVHSADAARASAMSSDIVWYRYLDQLVQAMPPGVSFQSVSLAVAASSAPAGGSTALTPTGIGTLQLNGDAPDYQSVASWLESVVTVRGLAGAQLSTAAKNATDGTVSYTESVVITPDALSHRYDETDG
jgi:type IV pilus assembly protein PilN